MSKGGGGSSSPSGSTTTTQQTSPWSGQQPFLQGTSNSPQYDQPGQKADITQATPGIFPAAAYLYENNTPQYFNQSTVSPFTGAQNSALNTLSDPSLAQPVSNAATNYSANLLGGNYLNNNPGNAGLSQYANGSMLNNAAPQTQDAINSAVANATPGLLDTFTGGNRLNSPTAAYGVGQGVANAAAPYVLQAQQQGQTNQINAATAQGGLYNQGLSAMNQGLAVAPNTATLPYAGAQSELSAGTTQQNQNQASLNDLVNRWNFGQQEPYNQLSAYQQMVNGNYGGTSMLTQPYFSQGSSGGKGGSGGKSAGSIIQEVAPLAIAAFAA